MQRGTLTAALVIGSAMGLLLGVGGFTFVYAKGASYLTSDPQACANCHVMNEQFDGWIRSSHRAVAGCNDCHTPHDFVGKWTTKALNGFNHSFAFTSGWFPEPIRIGKRNERITEEACRHCHAPIVEGIDPSHGGGPAPHPVVPAARGSEAAGPHADAPTWVRDEPLSCIRCHRSVGHLH